MRQNVVWSLNCASYEITLSSEFDEVPPSFLMWNCVCHVSHLSEHLLYINTLYSMFFMPHLMSAEVSPSRLVCDSQPQYRIFSGIFYQGCCFHPTAADHIFLLAACSLPYQLADRWTAIPDMRGSAPPIILSAFFCFRREIWDSVTEASKETTEAANRSAAHLEESVCRPSWQCCGETAEERSKMLDSKWLKDFFCAQVNAIWWYST